MNGNPPSAPSATRRTLSRRLFLLTRLACGGAVAGLFAGSILAAVSGAFLDSGPFGIDDIFLGPVALALIGAAWGFVLGADEPAVDDTYSETPPPSGPLRTVD